MQDPSSDVTMEGRQASSFVVALCVPPVPCQATHWVRACQRSQHWAPVQRTRAKPPEYTYYNTGTIHKGSSLNDLKNLYKKGYDAVTEVVKSTVNFYDGNILPSTNDGSVQYNPADDYDYEGSAYVIRQNPIATIVDGRQNNTSNL